MTVPCSSRPVTLAEWFASMTPQECVGAEPSVQGSMRFLFYGRASTVEHQDPRTSRAWQMDVASRLISGHGQIVGELFEVGCSRQVPWHKRPKASALLEMIADPANRIGGIVVGEYERAFDVGQLGALRPVLERHGVQLWLPEAGGAVEFGSSLHEALATVLAARSHAEVIRARHRVLVAMRMQTIEQGRFLGGRPPYGYRLTDDGPHPNRAMGRRGVRLLRLAPDPVTAPTVRWMFAERLAGRSVAGIARELNEREVPGPSGVDPDRNRHRVRRDWSLRTVTEILSNPRYTGYQVWNRTSADRTDLSPAGRRPTVRNDPADWVTSAQIAHPPLVSERDFVAVQAVRARRPNAQGSTHIYQLTGRLQCGLCGRSMEAHRVHGRAAYRCRHGYRSTHTRSTDSARALYFREDHLLDRIADLLTFAALAADPTPEQAAHIVRQLTLTFRCEPGTVVLLNQPDVSRRPVPTGHRSVEVHVPKTDMDPALDHPTKPAGTIENAGPFSRPVSPDPATTSDPTRVGRPRTRQTYRRARTTQLRAVRDRLRSARSVTHSAVDERATSRRPFSGLSSTTHEALPHEMSGDYGTGARRLRDLECITPRAQLIESAKARGVMMCPRGDLNPHPLNGD
ncbi:recombinase family protein [Actinokineospora guangxiensis]|uniref:Recombinase family protein n=1 Tax=Actinokineospora guangxiensis TaxID=1490288 RepID=A0ABW0ESF8_9PSEU